MNPRRFLLAVTAATLMLALPVPVPAQAAGAEACTTDESPTGLLEFGVFRRATTPADTYPLALPALRATYFRNHVRFVKRLGGLRYFLLPALVGDPLGSAGCPTTADGTENALLYGVGPGKRELMLGSADKIAFAFTRPGRVRGKRAKVAWAMVPDSVAKVTVVWKAVKSKQGRCCLTVRRTLTVADNVVLDLAPRASSTAFVSKLILRGADGSVVGIRGG